ncbi:deoxyuridine 5'-triphosphate nucleotidohydrolase, partial [Bartonella alsatica IBS 382]
MPHTQANAHLNTPKNSISSHPLQPVTLSIQRLKHGQGLELPHYATAGSAGLDLRAALGE